MPVLSPASSLLLVLLVFVWTISAIPTFEGAIMTSSSDSSVPGASSIEVMGLSKYFHYTQYLSGGPTGGASNITVQLRGRRLNKALAFYIHNNQLYQLNNQTSIFYVNAINTDSSTKPEDGGLLRLELGEKKAGVPGSWGWQLENRLHFSYNGMGNVGVYYACVDPAHKKSPHRSIYTVLKPIPTPEHCEIVTLHSFLDRSDFRPTDEL